MKMVNEYTISFTSLAGRLKVLLYFNNKMQKSKTFPILVTPEDIRNPPPALDNMLLGMKKRWNDLVIEYHTSGKSPIKLMWESRYTENKTPSEFFAEIYDFRIKRFQSFIDPSLSWGDITDEFLTDYHLFLDNEDVSINTIRTYLTGLKKALDDAKLRGYRIPATNYADILKSKSAPSISIYLTTAELRLLEAVELPERLDQVRTKFLIGAYTGARYSDFSKFTSADISSGVLQYISEKTKIDCKVPVHVRLAGLLGRYRADISNSIMNHCLPVIGEMAGINSVVTVVRGDKKEQCPKWKQIKSHTARRTFATNCYKAGAGMLEISRMLGHASVTTTQKYIAVGVNDEKLKKITYFNN